jgi:hypothetical protein
MRTIMKALLLGNVLLLSAQLAHADEYSDCMAKCAQDHADCMSEPQASETDPQTAKEAVCTEKASACYAECENMKPKDTVPDKDNSVTDEGTPQGQEQQGQ